MELYQRSLKNESKGAEVNLTYEYKCDDNPDGPEDHNNATDLNAEDFLINK